MSIRDHEAIDIQHFVNCGFEFVGFLFVCLFRVMCVESGIGVFVNQPLVLHICVSNPLAMMSGDGVGWCMQEHKQQNPRP